MFRLALVCAALSALAACGASASSQTTPIDSVGSSAGAGGSATQTSTVTVTAAEPGTATLSWVAPSTNTDGTAVTTLTGYTIYYGPSGGSLTQSIVVSGASTASYEITSLASGTWYFAVAADAVDGTQSAMSDLGSKSI